MKYIREFNTIEQATASENLIAPGVVFVNDPRLRDKIVTANFEVNSPYNIVQNGDQLKAVNGKVYYLLYTLAGDGNPGGFTHSFQATADGDTVTFVTNSDTNFPSWNMRFVVSESASTDDAITTQTANFNPDSNYIQQLKKDNWGNFYFVYAKPQRDPRYYNDNFKIVYTISTNSYYMTKNQ